MPVDHVANILALRAHALAMPPVALTSGVELEATATGYTRENGVGFLVDGFMAGMEVVPSGFVQTTPGVILSVTTTTLTIDGGRTVEVMEPGKSLSVALPSLVAWENDRFPPRDEQGNVVSLAGRWYVDEDYLPGPSAVKTTGPGRQVECTPGYVLKLYGPPEYGVLAHYTLAGALLDHFAPMTALYPSSGDVLRVRGDVAPYRDQLRVIDGFALITVTIPLRLRTVNSI